MNRIFCFGLLIVHFFIFTTNFCASSQFGQEDYEELTATVASLQTEKNVIAKVSTGINGFIALFNGGIVYAILFLMTWMENLPLAPPVSREEHLSLVTKLTALEILVSSLGYTIVDTIRWNDWNNVQEKINALAKYDNANNLLTQHDLSSKDVDLLRQKISSSAWIKAFDFITKFLTIGAGSWIACHSLENQWGARSFIKLALLAAIQPILYTMDADLFADIQSTLGKTRCNCTTST